MPNVEFAAVGQTAAFFNSLNFLHRPHLDAHLALVLPYNAMAYGLRQGQIRISVGLENQAVLLARCEEALSKVPKRKRLWASY